MKKQWMVGFALLVVSAVASAQGPATIRKQAESSLLVNGSIVIEPDGRTGSVTIDQPEVLPTSVVEFVTANARKWKFKPVEQDGKVVRAKAPMTVRVVAKQVENDSYSIQIRSASFGDDATGTNVKPTSMAAPKYPVDAIRSGVMGTVFLVLRIDRDGKVIDAIAEQTNLRIAAREARMEKFRKTLERASVDAAKKWVYAPPSIGDAVNDSTWTIRVPVSYSLGNSISPKARKYGAWESYIPGPRSPIPWVSKDQLLAGGAGGADAVGDGQVQQLGRGPQLLTPLGPG